VSILKLREMPHNMHGGIVPIVGMLIRNSSKLRFWMMVTSFVLTVRQKLFMTTLKLRQAMQLQCGSFQKGLV